MRQGGNCPTRRRVTGAPPNTIQIDHFLRAADHRGSRPPAAIAAIEALPSGDLRDSAISNAAATWATLDRAAATTWPTSLPDSKGKTRALEQLHR